MNEQPEALRLADALAEQAHHHRMIAHDCDMRPEDTINWAHHVECIEASAELRRLSAEVKLLDAKRKDAMREMRSLRADAERYRQIARINGWDERDDAEIDAARGQA